MFFFKITPVYKYVISRFLGHQLFAKVISRQHRQGKGLYPVLEFRNIKLTEIAITITIVIAAKQTVIIEVCVVACFFFF